MLVPHKGSANTLTSKKNRHQVDCMREGSSIIPMMIEYVKDDAKCLFNVACTEESLPQGAVQGEVGQYAEGDQSDTRAGPR